MTRRQLRELERRRENEMYLDHMTRGDDFSVDPWAQLAALHRHAKRHGRTFDFFRNHGAI